MNTNVEQYFIDGCGRCELGGTPDCKVHLWTELLAQLRTLLVESGLNEESKWGVPCYTYNGSNVAILGALKDNASVGFFKGVLLKDEQNLLVAPGKNSQAVRQFRFTSTSELLKVEQHVRAYLQEAIEIEKSGQKVEFGANPEPIPAELQNKLDNDPLFQSAFEALTPGKQRGYILHFSQPKNAATRISRIDKCAPKILNGEGMHDAYKSNKI
ncbi:MAG: YdeI/OmpD-associated family protein [Bacteroidetes bacterium]|nr:YdeI/OmpD-associated family protein [Bacteroidota bacterium]